MDAEQGAAWAGRLPGLVALLVVVALFAVAVIGWKLLDTPAVAPDQGSPQEQASAPATADLRPAADEDPSDVTLRTDMSGPAPQPVRSSEHRLVVEVAFEDEQVVAEGVFRLAIKVGDERRYLDKNLSDGVAELRVPHGAVLASADVKSLEVHMSQFGWQAKDVHTSGFVDCDALEQWEQQEEFDPRIEADRNLKVVVDRGVAFGGRIVDAVTGRGVAGAWVLVKDEFDSVGIQSGSNGSYILTGREMPDVDFDDEFEVTAYHPRYRSGRVVVAVEGATRSYRDVELRLEPGVRLSGSVVGVDGMPLAEARVVLMTERRPGRTFDELGQVLTCTTDDVGRFDLWGLDPASRADLLVATRRFGGARHRHGPFSMMSDQSGLVVAMPAMVRVALRPVFADGSAVDARSYLVAVLIDGEVYMTVPQLGRLLLPVGRQVELRVLAPRNDDRNRISCAIHKEVFAVAGDEVRDVTLEPMGSEPPWPVETIKLQDEDRRVSSSSSNVRSSYFSHDFWFEVVDAQEQRPLAEVSCAVTSAGSMGSSRLNAHGRGKWTFPSGRRWCRVDVAGYETRFFELRAPTGGSSRVRIEMRKLPD